MTGEILDYPLAPLTSWRIGGHAERFFNALDITQLSHYIKTLSENDPVTWLGLGSNVLIRDKGIKGVVIATRGLNKLTDLKEGYIEAQAGVTCSKLARTCARLGYADAAFFAGIPGTVGGALAMNAGAWEGQTWEWVKAVQVMDRNGNYFYRAPDEYEIGYRRVLGKNAASANEAFVGALFKFPLRSDVDGLNNIKNLLRKRAKTQPIGTFNCGSVYRNPPGDFAARLIEATGLKGYRIGDAMISDKHANFIINCHQALATDVESLMSTIENEVKNRFGLTLIAEVKILGQN